jgi:hypothetical protein
MDEHRVLLRHLKPGDTGLLLFRHADREDIQDRHDATHAPLTEEGVRRAGILGQILREMESLEPGVVISSPLVRCMDTAKHVVDGAGWTSEVQAEAGLKGQGTFTTGVKDAEQFFMDKALEPGGKQFLLRYARTETTRLHPNILPAAEGCRALTRLLKSIIEDSLAKRQSTGAGSDADKVVLNAACSHDLLLYLLLVHHDFGQATATSDNNDTSGMSQERAKKAALAASVGPIWLWPKFLEALLIWRKAGEDCYWMAYRDMVLACKL